MFFWLLVVVCVLLLICTSGPWYQTKPPFTTRPHISGHLPHYLKSKQWSHDKYFEKLWFPSAPKNQFIMMWVLLFQCRAPRAASIMRPFDLFKISRIRTPGPSRRTPRRPWSGPEGTDQSWCSRGPDGGETDVWEISLLGYFCKAQPHNKKKPRGSDLKLNSL